MLILVVRCTSPDLQLRAVCSASTGDVQAFVVENMDTPAGECPLLRYSVGAALDCNGSSVNVGRGGQAFG